VSGAEIDMPSQTGKTGAASLYCMATLVADEASRNGYPALAKSIETALDVFLAVLPRGEQRQALRMSYEMALDGDEPAPPRLRLVYSRD
jgi:hypothetical protein